MRAQEESINWNDLKLIIDELDNAIINSDYKKLRELLVKAVPDFRPQSEIIDFLSE